VSAGVLVPPGFVTVTDTGPAALTGKFAVIDVSLLIVKLVMSWLPTFTSVAVLKPVPVRVTLLPDIGPDVELRLVSVGSAVYVYVIAGVLVPPGFVTVTETGPAALAGKFAVIDVLLLIVKLVMSWLPTFTSVAVLKPVPVRVTLLPDVGPAVGLRLVSVGGPAYV
jgi:hypothetical protein